MAHLGEFLVPAKFFRPWNVDNEALVGQDMAGRGLGSA